MHPTLRARDLTALPLLPPELPLLQALLERCDDYHRLVYGRPTQPNEAELVLQGRPPGLREDQLHLWGLWRADGALGGVLDFLTDFPAQGQWYLGLLVLEPQLRGGGRGEALVEAFEGYARTHGARGVRVAVAEQNVAALRFWQRRGFGQEARVGPVTLGAQEGFLLRLHKTLAD
jgi:ribosomal protein S18 acetylase RimI-like enzyme